jgi:hypothetical protein
VKDKGTIDNFAIIGTKSKLIVICRMRNEKTGIVIEYQTRNGRKVQILGLTSKVNLVTKK